MSGSEDKADVLIWPPGRPEIGRIGRYGAKKRPCEN